MIKKMSAQELKALKDSGEEHILVDCREQDEWDDARIDGAILMPMGEFESHIGKLDDKNAKIT